MHDEMMIFGFVVGRVRCCRHASWRWSGEEYVVKKNREAGRSTIEYSVRVLGL
jgi:hypothetical protein